MLSLALVAFAGIVTVVVSVMVFAATKLPTWARLTLTVRPMGMASLLARVKLASVPSVMPPPALMPISGMTLKSTSVMVAGLTARVLSLGTAPATSRVSSDSLAPSLTGVRVNEPVALLVFAGMVMSKSATAL